MSKIVLDEITNTTQVSKINENFTKLETALNDKVLYRDNPSGEPNTLVTDVDVNGAKLYNLPAPTLQSQAARLQDVTDAIASANTAVLTSFTPVGTISSPNVQGAIQEVVSDLAASSGSSLVGFVQAEAGAIARTAQEKNRDIAHRSDFNSDVNFNSAKGNRPNVDAVNNFDAKVTPAGELAQISLSSAVLGSAPKHRSVIRYRSATSIYVHAPASVSMAGFRFLGSYKKDRAPIYANPTNGVSQVSTVTDLGAESTSHTDGWYAAFAVANSGAASFSIKLMPFLRVGSVAGSVVTLNSAKEGVHSVVAANYDWSAVGNLTNTDVLVISETTEGRANMFSGRVAKLTGNTTTTVTLDTIGGVAVDDWLLPAPPSVGGYCYLGSFYFELPGDVRNIGDSGTIVKAKMISILDPTFPPAGSQASPISITVRGYISPLASGVFLASYSSFSTASLGAYAEYFATDSSGHVVETVYQHKQGASTWTHVADGVFIPFAFGQMFSWANDGSLASLRAGGQLVISGWIEA